MLLHFNFSKRFLTLIAFTSVAFLANALQAFSQTSTTCIEDTLLTVPADSAPLADTLPTFANLGRFCSPTRGKIISHFGPRHKRFHAGTDIKLQLGDSVRAAFAGVVSRASKYYGYGLLVVLKHEPNIETYYGHLSKILVKVGDTISVGSVIGLGGRTGRATTTHLHFEFRVSHIAYDSEKLFDFGKQLVLANAIPSDSTTLKKNNLTDSIPNYDSSLTANTDSINRTQSEALTYTVRKKDTLYSLAKRYDTTVDSLCALNQIKPNGILHLGQKLRIR